VIKDVDHSRQEDHDRQEKPCLIRRKEIDVASSRVVEQETRDFVQITIFCNEPRQNPAERSLRSLKIRSRKETYMKNRKLTRK